MNTKGSGGAVTIDIADKLPENRGDTTYTVTDTTDSSGILQNVAVDTAGKLTYTVISSKKVGDKVSITVTAQMANYESATFTVNISITNKIVVALQNGSSVTINGSNALTYGDKLLKLNLGNASDYTIVVDEAPMDGSEADDTTEAGINNVTTEPKEDSWNPLWIIIIGAFVIVAGLGIFFIIKKKEDKDN